MPEADNTPESTKDTIQVQNPPSFRGVHEATADDDHAANTSTAVARERDRVEERQEEIMADRSVDGRPASHQTRRSEWRWIGFTLAGVAVIALTWALLSGVNPGVILGYSILGAFLLAFGGWPIWIVGMKRHQEEVAAEQQAVRQLNTRK